MKKFFLSKTLWLSLATICTGIAELAIVGDWEGFALVAIGAIFAYLRTISKDELTL